VDELNTLQMRYDLTMLTARILILLAKNQSVTSDMIELDHKLTKDTPVAIHRLRRRLAAQNITVNYRRGVGYWLDTEDRKKVLAAMVPDQLKLPLVGGGDGGSTAAA
jgi:DNA-binding response OmpR family regulator